MGQIHIKSPREIEKMRKAGRAAAEILDKIGDILRPGVLTRDVDQYAADLIAAAGCKSAFLGYRKFPGNICISINEQVVHGIGGARTVQYGDIVKLDVGVFKDGWVGDTAKTFPIGIIPPEVQRLLQVTEEALEKAILFAAGRAPVVRGVRDHREARRGQRLQRGAGVRRARGWP